MTNSVTVRVMTHALRKYRQENKISQEKLAGRLGVARYTLIRWECGKRKIEPERLSEISEKTGISPRDLRPDLAQILGPQ